MCLDSLRKGECFDLTCLFNHIKGTKRYPSVTENNVVNRKPPATVEDHQSHQDEHHNSPSTDHFLEVVRLLKAEILQTLETKISTLTSQIQHLQQRPTQLFQMPPPMSHQLFRPTIPPMMPTLPLPQRQMPPGQNY